MNHLAKSKKIIVGDILENYFNLTLNPFWRGVQTVESFDSLLLIRIAIKLVVSNISGAYVGKQKYKWILRITQEKNERESLVFVLKIIIDACRYLKGATEMSDQWS